MTHKTEKKKQHYFSWFQLMSSCTRSDRIHISSLFKNASRYFLHYHNGLLCHSEGKKIIIVFRCARPPKWWCWMSCQFSKRIVLCFKHLCLYLNTWLILISLFRKDLTLFLLQHWHCFLLITLVISKNIQSSNLPSCHETDQFIIIYITKKFIEVIVSLNFNASLNILAPSSPILLPANIFNLASLQLYI